MKKIIPIVLIILSSLINHKEVNAYIQPLVDTPQTIEEKVRQVFADAPIMVDVAKCESSLRQYNKFGKVLTNKYTNDYGVMQINRIHLKEAKALGYDIRTTEGNLGFARYLYNREGLRPWSSSAHCWKV